MTTIEALQPETIPLTGRHLIEASAGTGKTFNITRIYLRLLLERKLDVKNILVMTFTRAATEELRGRIAQEIRTALHNWGQFDPEDVFFTSLSERISKQDVYPVLHNALLHLDEAAIYTIHSFCKRVLSQQAFSSGVAFNVQMETDTADIELEAVRDWYRSISLCSSQENEQYELLTNKWVTPEKFRQAFREVLSSTTPIQVKSPESILDHFNKKKSDCLAQLINNQPFIFDELVNFHKKKNEREYEWTALVQWLDNMDNFNSLESMPKTIRQFFSGVRFSKKKADKKQQLVDIFAPINQLKEESGTIKELIQKADSYSLALQGIDVIRLKVAQAKQNARVMNYDDLINQLASSIHSNNQLAQQIQTQYPVALVDEFQDTDPQQYAILDAIYQADDADTSALYMIGDPKQAIYAFRSGDVFTYLSAREGAHYQWVMDTNWRSSARMVNAYNRLFYGAPVHELSRAIFGFNIDYIPVKAAGKADQTPLNDVEDKAALQLVHFPFNEDYRAGKGTKEEMKQDFCPVIANWVSSEVHRLLTDNLLIGDKGLQEQDIAILVKDKVEAAYIQDSLRQAGYPSVYLSTHDNVFLSQEALELYRALLSILELENDRAMVAGLSTRFMGCDSEQLFRLQEDEDAWETHREQFSDLRAIWYKRGFMSMTLKLLHQNYKPDPRHHERSLTNSIQLLEILQQASQRHRQPDQLLGWFREQIDAQTTITEAELRLESDANFIRIVTHHGSKGLEYPIVFIPFSTRYRDPAKFGSKAIDLFKYHDREYRHLNYFIGQDKTITDLYCEEAWAESIRLLYVAITRAEHRCYLCAAPFSNYHQSSLGQTLQLKVNGDLYQELESLLDSEDPAQTGAMNLIQVNELEFPVTGNISTENEEHLSPAIFNGRIERNWWLSSFSALTRNLRHGGISIPDRDQDDTLDKSNHELLPKEQIRFSLKKGAAAGNLLHDILEHTDFSQPHWSRTIERPLSRFPEVLDQVQQRELINWLESCLDATLPESLQEQTKLKLNKLNWLKTLRETEFYFPMEQVKPHALGQLLASYRKNTDSIQLPGHQTLQGMMHGFIDLVFQWQDRFYIADYKSSHLGNHISCYDQADLKKNIQDNYYDLQYLLYSLALHRYLKARMPDYDPDQHFGGVYYFYLRGMASDSDKGVFYTSISAKLLNHLDNLFSNNQSEELIV